MIGYENPLHADLVTTLIFDNDIGNSPARTRSRILNGSDNI